jgi:hypothetical protein
VLAAIGDRAVDEGAVLAAPLSAADADEGDTLTFSAAGLPAFCGITSSGTGAAVLACNPGLADAGAYPIEVKVADNGTPPLEDGEAIILTVHDVSQPPPPPPPPVGSCSSPEAVDDAYQVGEDGVLNAAAPGVLGNDTNPSGGPISAVKISPPTNGTIVFNADGSFTYAPAPNFHGVDSFTYRAFCGGDTNAPTNTATVVITVTPVNDPPAAVDDSYQVFEDTQAVLPAPGILENDADPDGDSLAAAVVSHVSNGVLQLNVDGSWRYTPNADFNGVDSFTYLGSDGSLDSNVAMVTLNVQPVNDAPAAVDDAYTFAGAGPHGVAAPGVLSNDTDVDGNPLTAVQVTAANNGTVVFNADGSFIYSPFAGFVGEDSFQYKAHDGAWESNVARVTIAVAPPP